MHSGELHAKLPRCSQVSAPYRGLAPQVWRAWEGLAAVPVGGGVWSRQISHVISDGHFLRPPRNVAIPTR